MKIPSIEELVINTHKELEKLKKMPVKNKKMLNKILESEELLIRILYIEVLYEITN